MSEEQEVISVSEYVADYEQLARIIFSPSMVWGEVVAPSAFFSCRNQLYCWFRTDKGTL